LHEVSDALDELNVVFVATPIFMVLNLMISYAQGIFACCGKRALKSRKSNAACEAIRRV